MESLAIRLDYNRGGFFYTGEIEEKLNCFKGDYEEPRTFYEYYMWNAGEPEDVFADYMGALVRSKGFFKFGFVDGEALFRSFGLGVEERYLHQFKSLFDDPLFRANVVLVETPAWTNDEILYYAKSEIVVEPIPNFERLMALRRL